MALASGKLRHRVQLQSRAFIQDEVTGETTTAWNTEASVWAAIEPLSVREFIQSGSEQSKVSARIVIRARTDINASWRILHGSIVYNVEGVLADKDSGLEYLTLAVSRGVQTQDPGPDAEIVVDGGGAAL